MELFFLISGAGSWCALKSRTAAAYLFERVKRLLIPLYRAGLFVLLPPQFYFEMLAHAGYRGAFWQIIPRYFASFYPPHITLWPETLLPVPFPGHLWFLQYLFLISLMTLPLLVKPFKAVRFFFGMRSRKCLSTHETSLSSDSPGKTSMSQTQLKV